MKKQSKNNGKGFLACFSYCCSKREDQEEENEEYEDSEDEATRRGHEFRKHKARNKQKRKRGQEPRRAPRPIDRGPLLSGEDLQVGPLRDD